jgi:hypothetical protein
MLEAMNLLLIDCSFENEAFEGWTFNVKNHDTFVLWFNHH